MQQTVNVGSYLSVYYAIILLSCNLIGRTDAFNPIMQSDWPHQDLDARDYAARLQPITAISAASTSCERCHHQEESLLEKAPPPPRRAKGKCLEPDRASARRDLQHQYSLAMWVHQPSQHLLCNQHISVLI